MTEQSVQERFAPNNICFGCGPANPKGLRIRSFLHGEELMAEWKPEPHHQAFPGSLNGGIIGALMDCHSNWAAALHLMEKQGLDHLPSTVTAQYAIKLRKPAPSDRVLTLRARVVSSEGNRAEVEASVEADGEVCATCRGTFVSVQPGHPAYHRW
jgi:acyl-coenzyme A thioesterase PaaI-like protein